LPWSSGVKAGTDDKRCMSLSMTGGPEGWPSATTTMCPRCWLRWLSTERTTFAGIEARLGDDLEPSAQQIINSSSSSSSSSSSPSSRSRFNLCCYCLLKHTSTSATFTQTWVRVRVSIYDLYKLQLHQCSICGHLYKHITWRRLLTISSEIESRSTMRKK